MNYYTHWNIILIWSVYGAASLVSIQHVYGTLGCIDSFMTEERKRLLAVYVRRAVDVAGSITFKRYRKRRFVYVSRIYVPRFVFHVHLLTTIEGNKATFCLEIISTF